MADMHLLPAEMPMSQSQQPRSQVVRLQGMEMEGNAPFKNTITGYVGFLVVPSLLSVLILRAQSQASKLAPSQRGTTDYQYFVSVWPLTELFDRVKSALEPINMRPPNRPEPATKMQLDVQPLRKGDIQKRDTKPGGDGVDIGFTIRDEQGQQLTGNVKILREFDSPLIEDLAPYWTKGGDVQVYTVKFTRRVGNPLQLRKLYQMVKVAMPPGLVSGS